MMNSLDEILNQFLYKLQLFVILKGVIACDFIIVLSVNALFTFHTVCTNILYTVYS